MFIVTTMSVYDLGALVKNRRVYLNNEDLIFGEGIEVVENYITSRLGSDGYVVAIKGRINKTSTQLLEQLDEKLKDYRVILETQVDERDCITFSASSLQEVYEYINLGLPDDMIYTKLDTSQIKPGDTNGLEIVCIPFIDRYSELRVGNLSNDLSVDVEGITVVKIPSSPT